MWQIHLILFAEKIWEALALQELLTFFQQIISMYFKNTLATTLNKFVINKLVKLTMPWTTGPRIFGQDLR